MIGRKGKLRHAVTANLKKTRNLNAWPLLDRNPKILKSIFLNDSGIESKHRRKSAFWLMSRHRTCLPTMAAMTQMSRVMLGGKTVAPSFSSLRPRTLVTSAARGLWLPDTEPPAHLKGELAGDRGFDPLGLGSDPERLKWWASSTSSSLCASLLS